MWQKMSESQNLWLRINWLKYDRVWLYLLSYYRSPLATHERSFIFLWNITKIRSFNICYILSELQKNPTQKTCVQFMVRCIVFSHLYQRISFLRIIIDLHQFTTEKISMHEIFRGYECLSVWTPRAPHFNSYNSFSIQQGTCFSFLLLPFSLICIVFDLIFIIYLEKKFSIFIHSETNFSDECSTFTSNVVA